MKKLLTVAALAFILMSCGNKKEAGLCVDKFYENPMEHIGKEVTITGHAKVCCCSGNLMITGCDQSKSIRVIPMEGVAVPADLKGATVKVKGIIGEEVIDENFVIALMDKANANENVEEKEAELAKAQKVKEIIEVEGIIRNYTIDASSIEITAACCKGKDDVKCTEKHEGKVCCEKKCDGKHEGKEGCEKKCDGKHEGKEGCEKKCEGKHEADKQCAGEPKDGKKCEGEKKAESQK